MEALTSCLLASLLGERLRISPSPVLRVNSSGTATITIHFMQFEDTPEHPYAFHVDWTSNASSERLGLISESKIVNGTARFSFSTTHNGSISVVAEFRVGHILPQNHRVTSNAVQVICKYLHSAWVIESYHQFLSVFPTLSQWRQARNQSSPKWWVNHKTDVLSVVQVHMYVCMH